MQEIKKILIIRLSSIGDVILSTALIRQVKQRFPDAEIDFLVNREYVDVLRYNKHLKRVIPYDRDMAKGKITRHKREIVAMRGRYDLVIDLQKNRRSRFFRRGLSMNIREVNKNRLHKLSLVYLKKPVLKETPKIPLVYLDTVRDLGVVDDGKGLEFWIAKDKEQGYYEPPAYKKETIISMAPGAKHFTKRFPADRYAELAGKLQSNFGVKIALLGGPADKKTCKIVKSGNKNIEDHSGNFSLQETAEMIDRSKILITNDTGVMHIAAARGVPTVAIFGSTVRDFGFAPFRVKHKIVETDVSCRPCTHIGRNKCPKGHFKCMLDISTNDIYSTIIEIM